MNDVLKAANELRQITAIIDNLIRMNDAGTHDYSGVIQTLDDTRSDMIGDEVYRDAAAQLYVGDIPDDDDDDDDDLIEKDIMAEELKAASPYTFVGTEPLPPGTYEIDGNGKCTPIMTTGHYVPLEYSAENQAKLEKTFHVDFDEIKAAIASIPEDVLEINNVPIGMTQSEYIANRIVDYFEGGVLYTVKKKKPSSEGDRFVSKTIDEIKAMGGGDGLDRYRATIAPSTISLKKMSMLPLLESALEAWAEEALGDSSNISARSTDLLRIVETYLSK